MKRPYHILFGLLAVGYIVACSPVKFTKDLPPCESSFGCSKASATTLFYSQNLTISGGKVDILIVDDNSASMSFEQHSMANRFSSFISSLDQQQLDYRIAITTTDISASPNNGPRPINQNGALQDGNLITFSNGQSFITSSMSDRASLLAQALVRPETFNCETFLNSSSTAGQDMTAYNNNCPSDDERGIYAANLTVRNNPNGFIRSDAALAVVFLGDEDVRSSVYYLPAALPTYALDSMDLPQTLINNVQSQFGGSKNFKAHAIIVRPGPLVSGTASDAASSIASGADPTSLFSGGDSSCLAMQNSQMAGIHGSYGYLYSLAARMTGGIEGDICASDYGSQLSNLGNNIVSQTQQLSLNCSNPVDFSLTFVSGTPVSYSIVGSSVQFSSNPSAGTQVHVEYKCSY